MKLLQKTTLFPLVIFLVIGLVTIVALTKRIVPSSIPASECIVLPVVRGEAYEVIPATGLVEAENEVLVRAPYTSIVKSILKEPGSKVQKGDVLLELDESPILDEISRIKDQLALKKNSLEKNSLSEYSNKVDLAYSEDVKSLSITSLKSQLADEEQLLEVGGISPARVEKTKQEIALAEKDLSTLKVKNGIRIKQLRAEEEGLTLGIQMQEKELAEKEEIFRKMKVVAPSEGIVLAVTTKIGEKVGTDNIIVRMSDLSTFKIKGTIEDKFGDLIKTGRRVIAVVDDQRLPGRIGNVAPVIENNKIEFNVHLEDGSNPKLKPNQTIPLWVVTREAEKALKIKNVGVLANINVLYVLKDGVAKKQDVVFGLRNNDEIQILSGVEEGDQIVIPKKGVSLFRNANSVTVK